MDDTTKAWTCLVTTSDSSVIPFMAGSYVADVVKVKDDPQQFRFFTKVAPPDTLSTWNGSDILVSDREEKAYHQMLQLMWAYDSKQYVYCHEKSLFRGTQVWLRASTGMVRTTGGYRR